MEVMERAVHATEQVWRAHRTAMRAAVDYAALHPVIGAAWSETVERFARTMIQVLRSAGIPEEGPGGASALADALCWMMANGQKAVSRTPEMASELVKHCGLPGLEPGTSTYQDHLAHDQRC
ncbi:hypothetical protein [Nonomuraea fuscirosea]|uniref:hypothetical protein n=1 Tax=Nonomuraea fuscirosea TaxID=1291556 RepID=UPI003443A5C6